MNPILGIDYGSKRIGLAKSDTLQIIASPYKTIPNDENLLDTIQGIMKDENVETLVIGLPIGMKGQETASTKNVYDFVAMLEENKISVQLIDERLSSVSAEKSLIQQNIKTGHNKELIDQTAAAIILQQYLDGQHS